MRRGRPFKKVTPEQIAEIRRRRAAGEKYEVLMAEFKITKGYIWYLTKRRKEPTCS
jgi:hypothetical protein